MALDLDRGDTEFGRCFWRLSGFGVWPWWGLGSFDWAGWHTRQFAGRGPVMWPDGSPFSFLAQRRLGLVRAPRLASRCPSMGLGPPPPGKLGQYGLLCILRGEYRGMVNITDLGHGLRRRAGMIDAARGVCCGRLHSCNLVCGWLGNGLLFVWRWCFACLREWGGCRFPVRKVRHGGWAQDHAGGSIEFFARAACRSLPCADLGRRSHRLSMDVSAWGGFDALNHGGTLGPPKNGGFFATWWVFHHRTSPSRHLPARWKYVSVLFMVLAGFAPLSGLSSSFDGRSTARRFAARRAGCAPSCRWIFLNLRVCWLIRCCTRFATRISTLLDISARGHFVSNVVTLFSRGTG